MPSVAACAYLAKRLIFIATACAIVRIALHPLTSFLIALFVTGQLAGAAGLLDSIARIRSLPPEEAARHQPVLIECVVTYRNPLQSALIAHDGREGIYVALPKDVETDVTTGARVRIEGRTEPGGFLPIIAGERVTVLGKGTVPEPLRIDAAELFSPSLDCQWVEVSGIVTGTEEAGEAVLVAEVSGWTVKLILPAHERDSAKTAEIMQRPVIIRGVVGSVFNAQRQLTARHLFVPSLDEIIPSESATPDGEARLKAVDELLRSDATSRTRVRVQGVITYAAGDGLYLRGEGGSLRVRAAHTTGLAVGTRIEVEGFAAVAPFRPILRATRFTILEQLAPPEPLPLDLSGADIVSQQAELVSAEADLLALRDGPDDELILQCRSGRWFFEAFVPDGPAVARRLGINDRVRLTGICELSTTRALPFSSHADGFRLHLRGADDVAIVRRAPWWTLRLVLWALGIVGVIALLSLAWVTLLRRRVREQTEIIRTQIERTAVKDERQRIARELHDTIEQELAGVSIQLRNARQRLANAPESAGASLGLAEKMLRHCREEARSSIRDLRSVALEQRGLKGAIEELLAPLAAESGAQFNFAARGESRSLPGSSEVHLLRIAHEAVANAVRHGAARGVQVRLEYGRDEVMLEVSDNGCGFDPSVPAPRGHFGLLGIHERANKLQATLSIESRPGAGTTVRVVVPMNASSRTASLVS